MDAVKEEERKKREMQISKKEKTSHLGGGVGGGWGGGGGGGFTQKKGEARVVKLRKKEVFVLKGGGKLEPKEEKKGDGKEISGQNPSLPIGKEEWSLKPHGRGGGEVIYRKYIN